MAELIRVAALSGYTETMKQLGVDPRPLLSIHGLSADLLANPEQLIPARAGIRLLEQSAAVTDCITLGLRMTEGRTVANLGASSLLIAHQPTLRKALDTLNEFRLRINSTLVLDLEEVDGQAILREDFALRHPEPMRQASNLTLAVLVHLCRSVAGRNWSPLLACFAHQPPPASELPIFRRIFQCPTEFDCDFNALVIEGTDLDRANPNADDQLAHHARRLLESAMSAGAQSTSQQVEQLITLLLPSGRATVQTCAASIGVSVRTLQRMLDQEGESFSEMLKRGRMQLATQYLANPRLRITDVSQLLGYASIGTFSRWYEQAFGEPPLRHRKRLVASSEFKLG